jgi:haloalkane dehalogenase
MDTATRFLAGPVQWIDTGTTHIPYRVFGAGGPPLICVHGWPLHGFTYRNLLPYLHERFTCYVLDLPGLGESEWSDRTDFSFPGQAVNLRRMIDGLGVESYDVLAHDTGATIARHLALIDRPRLRKLAIINTEMPGHRPPWIPLYRHVLLLPGSTTVLRALLRSDIYLRSGAGFGGCFVDPSLIEGDFKEHIVAPLIRSSRRTAGAIRYIRGLDWSVIDGLAAEHQRITVPVQFIWGREDPTFPEPLGRRMSTQFPNCVGFESIAGARLLPHEEKPADVARVLLPFLGA